MEQKGKESPALDQERGDDDSNSANDRPGLDRAGGTLGGQRREGGGLRRARDGGGAERGRGAEGRVGELGGRRRRVGLDWEGRRDEEADVLGRGGTGLLDGLGLELVLRDGDGGLDDGGRRGRRDRGAGGGALGERARDRDGLRDDDGGDRVGWRENRRRGRSGAGRSGSARGGFWVRCYRSGGLPDGDGGRAVGDDAGVLGDEVGADRGHAGQSDLLGGVVVNVSHDTVNDVLREVLVRTVAGLVGVVLARGHEEEGVHALGDHRALGRLRRGRRRSRVGRRNGAGV